MNSEDEPRYNYFGNYRSLFKGERSLNQPQTKRFDSFGNEEEKSGDDQNLSTPESSRIINKNDMKSADEPKKFSFSFQNPESHSQAILSKTPGIGLFSTNREKKASNYQSFFSFNSPKQEPRHTSPKGKEGYDQFVTGSEDDSGFFSETSLPPNSFTRPNFSLNNEYYPNADRPDKNSPFPTLPNENVNLTKLFFPNLDVIGKKDPKQASGMYEFENSDDFEDDSKKTKQPFFGSDITQATKKRDNQFNVKGYGPEGEEVRQRRHRDGPAEVEEEIIKLPPGLFNIKKNE